MSDSCENLRQLVAEVAAAYFSNSHVSPADIPSVVQQIASSLEAVGADIGETPSAPEQDDVPAQEPIKRLTPAQVRKSITPEVLISFEDGRPYKTLKPLAAVRGLTPAQYREKHGLPKDYPMVSASYSEARSNMAKNIGLGQKGRAAKSTRGG